MYQPGGCSGMPRELLIIATRATGFSTPFYCFISSPNSPTCPRDRSRAFWAALHISPPRPAFVNSRCTERERGAPNCMSGRCDPLSKRWISCHCYFSHRDRHVGEDRVSMHLHTGMWGSHREINLSEQCFDSISRRNLESLLSPSIFADDIFFFFETTSDASRARIRAASKNPFISVFARNITYNEWTNLSASFLSLLICWNYVLVLCRHW